MTESEIAQIPDVPRGGPLEEYRKRASFNWKKIKLFFEDFELTKYKNHIWEKLRHDPIFTRSSEDLPINKQKEISQKRVKRLNEYAFLTKEDIYEFPLKRIYFDEAIIMWDIDCSIKYSLNFQMFEELLRQMGTERHADLLKKCENLEVFGCFALTEMKHGSNTKEIKTTAHYDPNTEEFIINTPSFEDSKVWVGNLGKTATHAAVYAQLYTPDDVCHGMHIFIVPVRDTKTMMLLPGALVGEMGPKAGMNGIDNGFATFNKVRIPRENLLNRTGDVTPEGKYVTSFKDPTKRFGISLGALSNGRVGLTHYAACFMNIALTTAIRYAAIRKQFGPTPGNEISILEYQLHQYRLMPALAICFMWRNFSNIFFCNLSEFLMGLMAKDKSENQAELGKEIHAISCASKAVSSWTTQQVIQECREACGGVGYLKVNRFGDLRNSNDPLLTFEGDNNVLLQQTSNHLISAYEEFLKSRQVIDTPLRTLEFLKRFDVIMNSKFNVTDKSILMNQTTIMLMFDWLICYMLKVSHSKLEASLKSGKDLFTARNENQVFYSKTLAIIFMERLLIDRFIKKMSENEDATMKPVLNRLLFTAALYFLDKHVSIFYQGGFFQNDRPIFLIRETIVELCGEMKDESIGLIDSIAPPDFVLNTALGVSNGEAYKNSYSAMIQSNGSFDVIGDIEHFMNKTQFGCLKSKI